MGKALQDKIAVVTGGAQGLGAAICHRLGREGVHLVVADLNLQCFDKNYQPHTLSPFGCTSPPIFYSLYHNSLLH